MSKWGLQNFEHIYVVFISNVPSVTTWAAWCEKSRSQLTWAGSDSSSLFNSWPLSDQWCGPPLISVSLICEMGPVLTVHLAVRIRDNQHHAPEQSLGHWSYPSGAVRSRVHMCKWWSRIRWVLHEMRDVNRTQHWKRDESRLAFQRESVLGMSLERWAGCWQAVEGRFQ